MVIMDYLFFFFFLMANAVPLCGLTETTLKWISHRYTLWLMVGDESKGTMYVTYFVICYAKTSLGVECMESHSKCINCIT